MSETETKPTGFSDLWDRAEQRSIFVDFIKGQIGRLWKATNANRRDREQDLTAFVAKCAELSRTIHGLNKKIDDLENRCSKKFKAIDDDRKAGNNGPISS